MAPFISSLSRRISYRNWAQRLKRFINVDVEICDQCGGMVKMFACIEDPAVIKKSLDHLHKTAPAEQVWLPQSRAPPWTCLFKRLLT